MKKSLVFIHLNPAWEFYVFFCGLQGIRRVSKENAAHIQELIEPWFVFALIWSVGATGDSRGRVAFSSWLREKMAKEKVSKSKADPFSIIEEVVMRSRSQRVLNAWKGLLGHVPCWFTRPSNFKGPLSWEPLAGAASHY